MDSVNGMSQHINWSENVIYPLLNHIASFNNNIKHWNEYHRSILKQWNFRESQYKVCNSAYHKSLSYSNHLVRLEQ